IALCLAVTAALACGAAGANPGSRSLGVPWDGTLVGVVRVASEGPHFFTWDSVRRRSPNRGWRRYGNRRLVRTLLRVLREYAAAHPEAPRVGIGDLSRPHGGDFGARFGGVGRGGRRASRWAGRRPGRDRARRGGFLRARGPRRAPAEGPAADRPQAGAGS